MEILEVIKKRRSIRKFLSKPIPEKVINELAEALIWAPSAGNLQSRKFYFVFNQKIKEGLAKASRDQWSFIAKAPLVIVGCADQKTAEYYGEKGKNIFSICDVASSIQNLMLLAYSEGLGSVWVGAFDEKEVSKILSLPENLRPIAIIPVGYPAEKPEVPSRLKKKEVIKFIQ
jgi:nitroreductase